MTTSNTKNNGMGFWSILFLIFLTLKLCKVITWSWWWVFAPVWIPATLLLGVGFIMVLALFIDRRSKLTITRRK